MATYITIHHTTCDSEKDEENKIMVLGSSPENRMAREGRLLERERKLQEVGYPRGNVTVGIRKA